MLLEGRLVAVVTLLDETHEDLEGRWFAEAAFNGLDRMQHETFKSLDDVAAWIADKLPH